MPKIPLVPFAKMLEELDSTNLLRSLPSTPPQFSTDGALVPTQPSGDLRDDHFLDMQLANVASFLCCEVVVRHVWATLPQRRYTVYKLRIALTVGPPVPG